MAVARWPEPRLREFAGVGSLADACAAKRSAEQSKEYAISIPLVNESSARPSLPFSQRTRGVIERAHASVALLLLAHTTHRRTTTNTTTTPVSPKEGTGEPTPSHPRAAG